jgi:hypothetical protein
MTTEAERQLGNGNFYIQFFIKSLLMTRLDSSSHCSSHVNRMHLNLDLTDISIKRLLLNFICIEFVFASLGRGSGST